MRRSAYYDGSKVSRKLNNYSHAPSPSETVSSEYFPRSTSGSTFLIDQNARQYESSTYDTEVWDEMYDSQEQYNSKDDFAMSSDNNRHYSSLSGPFGNSSSPDLTCTNCASISPSADDLNIHYNNQFC